VNALAQIIHRGQVLAPMRVQLMQHDRLLDRPHQLRAVGLHLGFVRLLDLVVDLLAQAVLGQVLVGFQPALGVDAHGEVALDRLVQALDVPHLFRALRRDEAVDERVDDFVANTGDRVGDIVRAHQLGALLVDDLALIVGDVVVFEQVLAGVEVVRLDLALRALDLLREHAALDDLAFLHAGRLQPALGALRVAEDAHQVVFEREIEAARARVALTAGTAAQLVVDAPRLVALGADDVQAAGLDHFVVALLPFLARTAASGLVSRIDLMQLGFEVAAEHDVRAAAGHVGRDGHRAGAARLRDDVRFALVLLGVQHLVRDLLLLQQLRQELGGLDRGRADQRRLPALHAVVDVLEDRIELVLRRQVHEIRVVLADHRPVRRDHRDFQAIDGLELERLGVGGAGHARQLRVHAEVILERDRGDRLVLLAHAHAFLRFDRLMQTVRPAPPHHRAAGELVDDDHFAVADDVLDVAVIERVRAQRRVQVMHDADVRRVVQALARLQQAGLGDQLFRVLVTRVRQVHLARLLVRPVVALAFLALLTLQARRELVDLHVQLGALLRRAGDDQRRARFVDQDRVHLVDDRVGKPALCAIREPEREIVAQVVEAEFVVGAVGDVAAISRALFFRRLAALDHADRQAEEAVHRTHPVRVALRQVLVHRDHVHALGGQCVQVGRERRDQRLAFAGAHFGDLALVQDHAADQLHVEMAHPERAPRSLADRGKRLREQVLEVLAAGQALTEFGRLALELLVAQRLERVFQRVRAGDVSVVAVQQPLVAAPEQPGKPIGHDRTSKGQGNKPVIVHAGRISTAPREI
jgi:hypothetical protein